jgi:hypothetical protein
MKQIKIPFSLEEYNKGGYEVETRGDKNHQPEKVRIVCTNRIGDRYPLVVLLKDSGDEISYYYSNDDKYIIGQESYGDLVLTKQEFEDGDIIYSDYEHIAVFKKYSEDKTIAHTYIVLPYFKPFDVNIKYFKLASKKEKSLFLAKLAFNSKKWNPQTKQIEDIKKEYEFHLKDWCLMRCEMAEQWTLCQFSHVYDKNWVVAVGGNVFSQCIPYNEETKYLLGTADDCPDKYKTW